MYRDPLTGPIGFTSYRYKSNDY